MPDEKPTYATAEQVSGYKSPEPLQEDYTHSSGMTFRIEGISRAKELDVIYAEIERLNENAKDVALICGFVPDTAERNASAFCATCITQPKMTAEQWIKFGAEGGLGALYTRCLVMCRLIKDAPAKIPDGVEAAKTELEENPST